MRVKLLHQFLKLESASGIVLFMMAVVAMIWANSPLHFIHQQFIDASLFWINEGLMAVFFLLVGLELKRGFIEGQLVKFSQIALSIFASIGGMVVPVLVYVWFNHGNHHTLRGWATPVATDIAFALGVLSLFGRRIPVALKLFLMMLAIFDDLGAIIIIAVFYSHGMHYLPLFQSVVLLLILILFNRLKIRQLIPYLLMGAWLWLCLLKSGVHPTIAGFLLAMLIPGHVDKALSPVNKLERALHPWVAFLIMPLFALANAGFSVAGLSIDILTNSVVLGITLGLFVGKQVGVFAFAWLLIKTKWAKLPDKSAWLELYGIALLCGIGFTMSLFLGTLSFQNENIYLAEVRLGVIMGSILSALLGVIVLLIALTQKEKVHRRHH